jgi:Spy/CpxP family protein refolding chaperone
MKKTALIFGASLLFGSLVATAQNQDNNNPKAPATPALPGARTSGPPGFGATARPALRDRSEMLARMLGLTDEQKAKVKEVMDMETKQFQEIREKTQAKMKAILTPEQWEKYSRTSSTNVQQRMGTAVRPIATPGVPPAPGQPATPSAPATPK